MKRLFADSETVSWREEAWPEVLALYFNEQLKFVSSYCEWTGMRVLDAACGYGRFAHALADKGARVNAVDISMAMVTKARGRPSGGAANIDWQRADIAELPFRDECFDAVVCMEALMHVDDPAAAVREFARVIRPGGFAIVGINNAFSIPALSHALQVHHAVLRSVRRTPTVHRTNTIRQARAWLRGAGLQISDELGIGLLHPETDIALLRGLRIRLVPHFVARRFLALERKRRLGNTWLKHGMKAILMVGKKKS